MSAALSNAVSVEPLRAAVARMQGKAAIGTTRTSAQMEALPLALRERAFWSARLQSAHMAQSLLDMATRATTLERQQTGDRGDLVMSRSLFVREGRKMLDASGYQPGDPLWEGTLKDHRSKARLDLIYETNVQQAREFARWQAGQDEGALDAFPAQELIREESRQIPRQWRQRWKDAGGEFFSGGRMIALKSDPIWSRISRFGTPWPPFDFNSGMGVRDISRDVAEELGLIRPGETPQRADVGFNDELQASVKDLNPKIVDALMRSFNSERPEPQVELVDGVIKWVKQPGHQLSLLFTPASESGSAASVAALKEGLADLTRVVDLPAGPIIPMVETAKMHNKDSEAEYWPRSSGEHSVRVMAPKLPSGKLAQAHEVGHFLDELLGGGNGYASERSTDADMIGVMQAIHDSSGGKKAQAMDAATGEDYWARDSEMFARAFAQWAALKSGDDLQARILNRRAKKFPHAAWTKDDFTPIAEAMDYLFAKRRLRS